MKSALLGTLAGVVIAIIAVTSSCSINHKSDQYSCAANTDCSDGRICDNGFCIVAGSIDAPRPTGDGGSNNCPAPCTSCNTAQKTCTVNCMTANCTNGVLTCPAGYRCEFQCNTENACRNGINCLQAASCNIDCTARQSCEGILCGPGPCDVGCTGAASCRNIRCGASCACDVVCTGNESCPDNIFCSSLACKSGSGCTSVPALCHSCN